MQVERSLSSLLFKESGERVSNTWVISPRVRNNPAKAGLIPHNTLEYKLSESKLSEQSDGA
jgi:hypothetical protein